MNMQDLSGINTAHILEPLCSFPESPKPNIITAGRRRLLEALSDLPTSNTRDPFCRVKSIHLCEALQNFMQLCVSIRGCVNTIFTEMPELLVFTFPRLGKQ